MSGDGCFRVVIIGGGLVGSLAACFMAKRGYNVRVYDRRDDIRRNKHVPGRSINLSLSLRGLTVLERLGLDQDLLWKNAVPMTGRVVHHKGNILQLPFEDGQVVYSVGRGFMNKMLLNAAERYPNVKIHFNSKMTDIDVDSGSVTFLNIQTKESFSCTADLIIAADGAHSSVRREMLRRPGFNYSQEYISHQYLELCIPATSDGEFPLVPNSLHVWPTGDHIMFGLPTARKAINLMLMLTTETFQELNNEDQLVRFFRNHFPDVLPLLTQEKLVSDFFASKPYALSTVKCEPYHVGEKTVLIGDAARGVLLFYGQGMNAGFEDCLLLDRLLDQYGDGQLATVLKEYSSIRVPEGNAVCKLSIQAYDELREFAVNKRMKYRLFLDKVFNKLFGNLWVSEFNLVVCTRTSYRICLEEGIRQNKVVRILEWIVAGAATCIGFYLWNRPPPGVCIHVLSQ